MGFVLLRVGDLLVSYVGFSLVVSNSLMDIGAALLSARYAISHPSIYSSEPAWKLVLLPAFAVALYLALRAYRGRYTLRVLVSMAAITAALGLAAIPLDKLLWTCMERGIPYCRPVAGISIPVIVTNIAVAIAMAVYIARLRRIPRDTH